MLNEDSYKKLVSFQLLPLSLSISESLATFKNLSRPPSVPVLGRKLSSESILTINEDPTKHPFTVKMFQNKPKNYSIRKAFSSTKLKRQIKPIEIAEPLAGNSSRKSSVTVKRKPRKKREKKTETVPKASFKSPKGASNEAVLKKIVSKSIKTLKKQKKISEKKERLKNEAKNKIKNDVKLLNFVARKENLKNFKTKVFRPKFPWGADEKRIEKSAERKKEGDNTQKVFQKPLRKLRLFKKARLSLTPEEVPVRQHHPSNPEIREYLKHQKKLRKISKDCEKNQMIEKENKRILQLKHIDVLSKQIVDKKNTKRKVSKKILKISSPIKWVQKKIEDFSNENRNNGKETGCKDESYYISKAGFVSDNEDKHISQAEHDQQNLPRFKTFDHSSNFKKKTGRLELIKLKKKQDPDASKEIYKNAAVRIQSAVRKWLTRKNSKKLDFDDSNSWLYKKQYPDFSESFDEEDEEVKRILKGVQLEKKQEDSSFFKLPEKNEVIDSYSPIFKREKTELSNAKNNKEKLIDFNKSRSLSSPFDLVPSCDLFINSCSSLLSKTTSILNHILKTQIFEFHSLSDLDLQKYISLFKDYLAGKDKSFIQSFYQRLQNLSNQFEPGKFLTLIQEVPNLNLIDLIRYSETHLSLHESQEMEFSNLVFSVPHPIEYREDAAPIKPLFLETEKIVSEVVLELEHIIISDEILNYILSRLVEISEIILLNLVKNESLIMTQKVAPNINEGTLIDFADQLFSTHGDFISKELTIDKREDPLTFLSFMQECEIGSCIIQEFFEIVPVDIFISLVSKDFKQLCIYKKMVFDSINEGLMTLAYQSKMPWSLASPSKKKVLNPTKVYCKILSMILKWNSFKIGKIVRGVKENNEGLKKFQETKILSVLNQDVLDMERIWINYEFEETQLTLDLSDMVLEYIVEEVIDLYIIN